MSAKYSLVSILYIGPSRDPGVDIALVAAVGGNKKTSGVIDLLLVPFHALNACQSVPDGSHVTVVTRAYVDALKHAIASVCGKCPLSVPRIAKSLDVHACYAQLNFQNAGQAATLCRYATGPQPTRGTLDVDVTHALFVAAHLAQLDHVRSCVAGDLGMLPEDVARDFIACVPSHFTWLGYTHQWHRSPWLRATHMASTQGPARAYRAAQARGWRPFHVLPADAMIPTDLVHCPEQSAKLHEDGPASCIGCTHKCDGTTTDDVGTFILDHGPGARWRNGSAALALLGGAS
jgi:hypothetical protein